MSNSVNWGQIEHDIAMTNLIPNSNSNFQFTHYDGSWDNPNSVQSKKIDFAYLPLNLARLTKIILIHNQNIKGWDYNNMNNYNNITIQENIEEDTTVYYDMPDMHDMPDMFDISDDEFDAMSAYSYLSDEYDDDY
jgi:hypothetical protein